MITINEEISLHDFEPWSEGESTLEALTDEQISTLESAIEDLFPNGLSRTQLNDLLWFDIDWIAETLGFRDWEDLEKHNNGEDDEEEDCDED